jgi:hypothetical protein
MAGIGDDAARQRGVALPVPEERDERPAEHGAGVVEVAEEAEARERVEARGAAEAGQVEGRRDERDERASSGEGAGHVEHRAGVARGHHRDQHKVRRRVSARQAATLPADMALADETTGPGEYRTST